MGRQAAPKIPRADTESRSVTLKSRLDACAKKGALSTADLAVWFNLPYGTVRSYRQGIEPYDYRRPQIEQSLTCLESAVAKNPGLPMPLSVFGAARKKYLRDIRAATPVRK